MTTKPTGCALVRGAGRPGTCARYAYRRHEGADVKGPAGVTALVLAEIVAGCCGCCFSPALGRGPTRVLHADRSILLVLAALAWYSPPRAWWRGTGRAPWSSARSVLTIVTWRGSS